MSPSVTDQAQVCRHVSRWRACHNTVRSSFLWSTTIFKGQFCVSITVNDS